MNLGDFLFLLFRLVELLDPTVSLNDFSSQVQLNDIVIPVTFKSVNETEDLNVSDLKRRLSMNNYLNFCLFLRKWLQKKT